MANQIYQLINNIATDCIGGSAFTNVYDTSTLVSLGNTLDELNAKDLFYGKFHKMITKVLYKVKSIERSKNSRLVRDIVDFNSALMIVEADDFPDATLNNSLWTNVAEGSTMSDGGQKDPFGSDIDGTFDFSIQYFTQWATWSFEKMIPEYQHGGMFSANYEGFINMIYTMLSNSFDMAVNNAEKLALATAICTTKDSSNTNCYRNLLAEYNEKFTKTLTVATCLSDAEFLRFMCREISLVTKKIKDPNKIYSPTGKLRWVGNDDLAVDVLSDVASALGTYLYADTYHKELVELNGFREVGYWLGKGTSNAFADISRVACVTADGKGSGQSGADVQTVCTGVIATVYDVNKCMVTMDKERQHTIYNPRSEVLNIFNKIDIGMASNKNAPMVVFTIEDVEEDDEE
ncbi:MAG: hypothetical protein MJZ37_08425 [Bacilli bacterium]|nr:hypothetical protein [Bacilli bacterium]